MKKISVLLALMALFFADLAAAAGAAVTSATGTVQVQTGSGSPRNLRQGDEVSQGDTVITGANSAAVLKFDDGQVAALTANSRMTISTYTYNPASESGNVLLSLISGGMRAVTGLIGRRSPNQVAYRAASATIGIRGTDTVIATDGGNVVVSVSEGSVTLTQGGQTLVITAGEAVFTRPGAAPVRGTIAQIQGQLPPAFQQALTALNTGALNGAINAAGPGQPRQGGDQTAGDNRGAGFQSPGSIGTPPGGGAGGGSSSAR